MSGYNIYLMYVYSLLKHLQLTDSLLKQHPELFPKLFLDCEISQCMCASTTDYVPLILNSLYNTAELV